MFGSLLFSCSQEVVTEKVASKEVNPPSEGFNTKGSDAKAMEIADAVMASMGGRPAWDELKIVKWNFFGARKLTWNKHSGDVRIDFPDSDSNVFITNVLTHQGKIKLDGEEVTVPDSVKK